jgi:uncharacterized protein (TIGR02594 family)
MKNLTYAAVCVVLLASCDRQAISSETINVGNANPLYEAVQYNGLHERTDREVLAQYVGVDPVRTEWCAAFVNAVLEESNITSNSNHKYPLTARAFLDWGESVPKDDIQPGDIVVFPRGNQGWQGHVGFYLRTEEINGIAYYWILGGNQRNKVSVVRYKQSSVLGIRRSQISVDNRDKMSYNNRVLGNLLRR